MALASREGSFKGGALNEFMAGLRMMHHCLHPCINSLGMHEVLTFLVEDHDERITPGSCRFDLHWGQLRRTHVQELATPERSVDLHQINKAASRSMHMLDRET